MNTFIFANDIMLETFCRPGVGLSEEDISLEDISDFLRQLSRVDFSSLIERFRADLSDMSTEPIAMSTEPIAFFSVAPLTGMTNSAITASAAQ
ncbi:MAG: hypothetical protein AAF722_01240 [Cyanobacteria bacterium P01_C01_bin.70]